jgi:hypothetical protein
VADAPGHVQHVLWLSRAMGTKVSPRSMSVLMT